MSDNQFLTPSAGQADWDASLTADLGTIERGYHWTERAGVAINSGNVVWINSGGFAFPFNPNSEDIYPHGFAYTAASSGDTFTALAWGIVRSFGINSPSVAGFPLYVSALTPGLIVRSYNGANRPVGMGLTGYGVLFRPWTDRFPETLSSSQTVAAVTGSLHLFTVAVGKRGIDREIVMIGNSADLVELKFYSDTGRTRLLYATKSGGVSTVGSFQDRALWPWENTDAVNSATVYGSLKIMSAALVGSDTISIQGVWDRYR